MLAHLDNAYGKTLRQYHGWVVRGVFAVSVSYMHHWWVSVVLKCDRSFPPVFSWRCELLHLIKVSRLP